MATYVMSDVHGSKDKYDKMLLEIDLKYTDDVYILGDVIDRGCDGIEILQDIMKRKNITLLMGNHEYMMKEYYMAVRHELDESLGWAVMDRWERNGCAPTIAQFEQLDKEEQASILAYIDELPIAITDLEIGDALYYFVHACPVMEMTKGTLYLSTLVNVEVERFIWDRFKVDQVFFEDRIVVVGHTPTTHLQTRRPHAIWKGKSSLGQTNIIDIDCGCASQNGASRLACLRLDDMQEFYV